jgi:alpha-beta hydrolase superfamily lysophospholipase
MKHAVFIALLAMAGNAYGIKPEREYKFTPDKFGLQYTERQVTTPDGYSINVWEYALSDSVQLGKTIILVGTDAGNIGYFIWQARALLVKGFRVIAFDYRGFGKSSDFKINSDYLFHPEFAIDLDTVIREAREKYPKDKIGLYAMSMGTYVSLLRKERVDFAIAEGFYHDPQKVVDRIKVNKGKEVLLPPVSRAVSKFRPDTPILIFCASNDKTTMTEDAREFSRKNKVTIIEFQGDHLAGMRVLMKKEYGDDYVVKIVEYLSSLEK